MTVEDRRAIMYAANVQPLKSKTGEVLCVMGCYNDFAAVKVEGQTGTVEFAWDTIQRAVRSTGTLSF